MQEASLIGKSITAPPPRDRVDRWRYLAICGMIVVLCVALKLPSLFWPRLEYDERIYIELTANWHFNGAYSLRGTPVLGELPPSIYDKPLFHHPPLLALLLRPIVAARSAQWAILPSWLGHVLSVVGVAMAVWSLRRPNWSGVELALWLPVLGVAVDPNLAFCARKVWPDNLSGGFSALAMGLWFVAADRRSVGWAVAGGVALGLAGLAKLLCLVILPAGLLVLASGQGLVTRQRWTLGLAAAASALVVVAPWLIWFFAEYGSLLPTWIRPDTALRTASTHVDREMGRAWHFYIAETIKVAPVMLVVFVVYVLGLRRLRTPRKLAPLVWVALVFAALLVAWRQGHGMQMRYLTPAVPGLYVMMGLALGVVPSRRSLLPAVMLVLVVYGAVWTGFYLLDGRFDEIVAVPEMLWQSFTETPGGSAE